MLSGGVDDDVMTDRSNTARPPVDDVAAFDRFFADEYATAVRLAHLLTGQNASAEDIAQDAFASVASRFERLDNPAAYLRTSIVNTCRTWHRTRSREQDRFRRHGPSEHVAVSTASAELLDTIRRLPYRQQAVLVLRYWLDLSESQIALALGCRPGTVKSLHSRACEAIRKDLR